MPNLVMCVSKEDGGHILLGELEGSRTVDGEWQSTLTNVAKLLVVAQGSQAGPVLLYYPTMFVKNFIKNKVLDDMKVPITSKEYLIFEEESIDPPLVDMYRKEISRRIGIEIVTNLPPNVEKRLKLVNP